MASNGLNNRVKKLEGNSKAGNLLPVAVLYDHNKEGDEVQIEQYCREHGCTREERQFIVVTFVAPGEVTA